MGSAGMMAFLDAMARPYAVLPDADRWAIMDAVLPCLAKAGPQTIPALCMATGVGVLRLAPVLDRCQRAGLIVASGGPGREVMRITANGQALLPALGRRPGA